MRQPKVFQRSHQVRNRRCASGLPSRFVGAGGLRSGLCEMILPAYRDTPEKIATYTSQFREFTAHVKSAEPVSFGVKRWIPAAERFGGAPAALVWTAVRYNELPGAGDLSHDLGVC